MKKFSLLVILITLTFSCSKKEVKIPVLPVKGLQELHNHSQIWFFFQKKDNDTIAKINRNNAIVSTHWIYTIDRRLPLKTIVSKIQKFKDRHANSMHSKEGMHNYFSYSDTISKKLSFFLFDSIQFTTKPTKKLPTKLKDSTYKNISIFFQKNTVRIDDTTFSKEEWKNKLAEYLQQSEKKQRLFLSFDETILFQDYLWYRSIIRTFEGLNSILCEQEECVIDFDSLNKKS
ncbi:MAG: hypothetical protein KGV44_00830 [Flavobacteriaceae bacterium]|nr:hypothetical protein [Flavobacteriaceae bacterium]